MKTVLSNVFGWGIILFSLFFAIQTCAFNRDDYYAFYKSHEMDSQLNVSLEDINASMDLMLDYLEDKREDLNGTITKNNEKFPTYNEKEKKHMEDVKSLYQNAKRFCYLALILAFISAVLLWIKYKKTAFYYMARGMEQAGLCFLILLSFIGIWAATDFTDFWIHFHQMFFSNNLWLLDPATDFMINICPEQLFSDLVFRIITRFLIIFLVSETAAVLYLHRQRKGKVT